MIRNEKYHRPFFLYGIFHALYFIYFLLYVKWTFWFDVGIYYFFYGSIAEFREGFPNYYAQLFTFAIVAKLLLLLLLGFGIYYLKKNHEQVVAKVSYNSGSGYIGFLKKEVAIILIVLLLYLLLYFSFKFFLERNDFHELQVMLTRGFLFHIGFQTAVVIALYPKRIYQYLKSFLLFPDLPYNIAILRILIFSYFIYIYYSRLSFAAPIVALEQKVALPYMGWLIEMIPVSPALYQFFVVAGIICCALIVLGWQTRHFLIANAICCFYIMAVPNFFGKLWHEQLIVWISWYFALSACYDVFSIDAKLKPKPLQKNPAYSIPLRILWLQLGIIYFWAGFYKLWDSGFDWALSSSMINQVQLEWLQNYDRYPGFRIDKYPFLLHLGGLSTILFEMGYVVFLLKPPLRWIAVLGGLMMHNFIGYIMYISFFHMLQVFYVVYFNFNVLFERKTTAAMVPVQQNFSKAPLIFGLIILSSNFFCGMFSIDSYPFSAYPKYSAIIPEKIKIIQFDAYTADGKKINVHEEGKLNRFSWESYGWLEFNLIRDYEEGKDVSKRIDDYWKIWTSYNPSLRDVKHVKVSIIERPVAPEGREEIDTLHVMRTIDF